MNNPTIRKHCLILLSMCLFFAAGHAQIPNPEIPKQIAQMVRQKAIRVSEHPQTKDPLVIYLPMFFSSAQFLPETKFQLPQKKEVVAVHLVYTRYRQVDTFNQPLLNEKRFLHLSQKLPELFGKKEIEWRVFEQTKGTNEDEARKMFHGFIIFLKEPVSAVVSGTEMNIIDDLLSKIRDSLIEVPEQNIYRIRKKYVETGRYIPRRSDKVEKGIRYDKSGIWFREPETKIVLDSVIRKTIKGYSTYKGIYTGSDARLNPIDVYNQLRNKSFRKKWAFVVDVTGSMAPYTGQVLALLKTRPDLATDHYFSFFNDGNGAPEILKRVGNSGGIYTVKAAHFDTIYQTMERAMRAGTGGDLPENNIEAILRTIKQWPTVDSILMLADAHAPVKDLQILNFVNKPVHLVLCGDVSKIIPIDYVRIAKSTQGLIITNEGEIRDLHLRKVGQTIEVGGAEYLFTHRGLERR